MNPYDPDLFEEQLAAINTIVAGAVRGALKREGKVLLQKEVDEILRELHFDELIASGGGNLPELARIILANSTRLHHPRYMGHQVAVPMLPSSFGDLLNGIANNGMAVYEMGSASTAIERGLIRWMLNKAGPAWSGGDGVLTHGGSLANLSCLLAARAKVLPDSWRTGVPAGWVFMASDAAHYSVSRAAAILGFGSNSIVKLPVDESLRIKADALESTYAAIISSGKKVLAFVANAGATPTGAYDPLREIGLFCRAHNIWFHVDGAHGASALISDRHRALMDGIEFADSLCWDTHKLMATSIVCGAALVRDAKTLPASYAQEAPYLTGNFKKPGEDLWTKTFECTKSMLGLKLFFNIAAIGEKGLAAHVDHLLARTLEFYEYIGARKGFECLCRPQSNILCFRRGTDSAQLDAVRNRIVREGNFYLTRTTIGAATWLRLVIMNPFTDVGDIAALCDEIEKGINDATQ